MIRCVGAALRGDGNPPEVPVAVLAERLCEAKYSELYLPEGALIKDGASPVCKCALPTSEDLYLDSEKGMMVLSRGAAPPVPWRRA